MNDVKNLEKKIRTLEERMKQLEDIICSSSFVQEKELMNQLYQAAKDLVIKHQKASVIFLQRKLLIDLERAKKLLEQLEANGVVGPDVEFGTREVLIKK